MSSDMSQPEERVGSDPRPARDALIGSTDPAGANELGGEPFAKAQNSRANSATTGPRRSDLLARRAMVDVARGRTRSCAWAPRRHHRPWGAREGGRRQP